MYCIVQLGIFSSGDALRSATCRVSNTKTVGRCFGHFPFLLLTRLRQPHSLNLCNSRIITFFFDRAYSSDQHWIFSAKLLQAVNAERAFCLLLKGATSPSVLSLKPCCCSFTQCCIYKNLQDNPTTSTALSGMLRVAWRQPLWLTVEDSIRDVQLRSCTYPHASLVLSFQLSRPIWSTLHSTQQESYLCSDNVCGIRRRILFN